MIKLNEINKPEINYANIKRVDKIKYNTYLYIFNK